VLANFVQQFVFVLVIQLLLVQQQQPGFLDNLQHPGLG
jgi:hypothetical protein